MEDDQATKLYKSELRVARRKLTFILVVSGLFCIAEFIGGAFSGTRGIPFFRRIF